MSTSREKRAQRKLGAVASYPTYSVTINGTEFSYTPGGQETLEQFMATVAAAGNLDVTKGPDGTLTLTPRPPVQVIPLRSMGWPQLLALVVP